MVSKDLHVSFLIHLLSEHLVLCLGQSLILGLMVAATAFHLCIPLCQSITKRSLCQLLAVKFVD